MHAGGDRSLARVGGSQPGGSFTLRRHLAMPGDVSLSQLGGGTNGV